MKLHRQTYLPTEEEHHQIEQTILNTKRKKNIDIRDWTILIISSKTGLRIKEILNLKLTDIDWDKKTIRIRPEIAKNKTEGLVWISPSLEEVLKNYIKIFKPTTYIFFSVRNKEKPLKYITFYMSWRKAVEKLPFNEVRFTDLMGRRRFKIIFHTTGRTYFINQLFRHNKEKNIVELARITRHKNINCLNDYYLRFKELDLWKECVKF